MRVVVVGTGTEIGKTHVCAALLSLARARGVNAAAFKPIATGVTDRCEDADRHAAALGSPYVHPTFTYREPISPHVAAREEGRPIDLPTIVRLAAERASGKAFFLVETAGGLFSPLSDRATNADLVRALAPSAACTMAAGTAGVPLAALVLSAPPQPDASTGRNAAEFARLGLPEAAAVFPRKSYDAPESLAAAGALWRTLELRRP